MRIGNHPILSFVRAEKVSFLYDGKKVHGFKGDTIAAALHALGIYTYSHSPVNNNPRGIFCAIGHCSSCLMTVDGVPNVRICITEIKEGMQVQSQGKRGVISVED